MARLETKYLIVGSSHAALEAMAAIRMLDPDGPITMATRDQRLPYSPTVLPYVVSGKSDADAILLRDQAYFERHKVDYRRGSALKAIDPARSRAVFENGDTWQYQKLLLATGAVPAIPPIEGLDGVDYHVMRTLDDALDLKKAIGKAKSAIALGAGLVGMAGAENLAKAGLEVTIVEMLPQVLPGYFDPEASEHIRRTFTENGVSMLMGRRVTKAARRRGGGCELTLDDGATVEADILLVGTGVRAELGYLDGSGLETDRGILVDPTMRTTVDNIWAAGDCVQAGDFYSEERIVSGILPNAVEQGRIAGMDMIADPGLKPFPGSVPLNTYTFYGQQAISVGIAGRVNGAAGLEVEDSHDRAAGRHLKIVLKEDRLLGIAGINVELDPGIMWQLILRRVDLASVKKEFLARPTETGRALMSTLWR